MFSSIRSLIFSALIATSSCGSAIADITVQRLSLEKGPPILLLKGKFTSLDDPQVLTQEVTATGAKVVTFDSPGGNVVSAIAFGRKIRSLGLSTFQLREAECASACTLAFVGGIVRQAEPGAIGVHQSSFSSDANLDSHQAVTAVQAMTAEIMTYLIEMDVDPRLLQLSLSVPSNDMRYLTAGEMRNYRVTLGSLEDKPSRVEAATAAPDKLPKEDSVSDKTTRTATPPAMTTEEKALAFTSTYHDAWSRGNGIALQFMDQAYANVVDFYGKPVTKAEVIEEKRKFVLRWPTRAYNVRHGSARAACVTTCEVSGVVDWYARRDVGDRVSSGSAEFTLIWDPATGTIVSETGKVLGTDTGADRPIRLITQWHYENTICRGSSGDSPDTLAACDRREVVYKKLEAVGWCYGRKGEYGYQMYWHPCEDAASQPGKKVASRVEFAGLDRPKSSDYPSLARMTGKTVLPDFRKRDREFNSYRTRIREGMQSGPNYAGHYSVIQFGCGTGCSGVVIGNNKTGRPISFPRGGQSNMYLDLQFQLDSRLMAAQWFDYDSDRCFIEFFDFTGQAWKVVSKTDIGSKDSCNRSVSDNLR